MNKPSRFTQAEIARALRAAVKLGVRAEVIIEPDGTIRIREIPVAEDREIVL